MGNKSWNDYFTKELAEAELELARYKSAIDEHGLRVFHRDVNGERDVTEQELQALQTQIDEYRAALRDE